MKNHPLARVEPGCSRVQDPGARIDQAADNTVPLMFPRISPSACVAQYDKVRVLTAEAFQFGTTPFYFLRHGETNDSTRGIVQGQRETELNEEGRRTARKAARLLSPFQLGSIYSSPLQRAWSTAEIISQSTDAPIFPLPGLMERNWGAYQGKSRDTRPQLRDPTGVERTDDFSSRVLESMKSIIGPLPVLVVAHSGVFRVLCSHVGLPVDRRAEIANGLVLRFDPPTHRRQEWHIGLVAE